jgi:hypothetical protein
METSAANMVSVIDVHAILDQMSDSNGVVGSDSGEKLLGWSYINLGTPFTDVDGIEAARNTLTTRVFLNETFGKI